MVPKIPAHSLRSQAGFWYDALDRKELESDMAVTGEGSAETTGEDNLKTIRLIFAAYESAANGQTISIV